MIPEFCQPDTEKPLYTISLKNVWVNSTHDLYLSCED